MTPALLAELAVAAGVTAFLIALSWLLGAWRSVPLNEAAVRDRLAFDEPDFRIDSLLIGSDHRSALALDVAKGEAAVAFALGDAVATRRFKRGSLGVRAEGANVTVVLKDISKWRVRIAAASTDAAEDWARRIGKRPLDSGHGVS